MDNVLKVYSIEVRELFIRGTVDERIEGPEEKDEIYSLKACIASKEQTKIKKASFRPI